MTYLNYRLAQWMSVRLPSRLAFRIAERLADSRWRSSASDRMAVEENLSLIFGSIPRTEGAIPEAWLVREVFRNFGRYLVEFLRIHQVPEPTIRIEGREHLTAVLEDPHGAIALTAHLGNWELAGIALRRMGVPMTVVALPHEHPRVDQLFNRQRERCGLGVIPLGPHAARQCLAAIRPGHLLGLLGDRDFSDNGIAAQLFGRTVILPRGPLVLSLRTHAPILPLFLTREGEWIFRLRFETPIWPMMPTGARRTAAELAQAYAETLEAALRRTPEQWLVFRPLASRMEQRPAARGRDAAPLPSVESA